MPTQAPLPVHLQSFLLAADKLRIGFHTALGQIHSFVLFLFADTHTHHRFDDAPHQQTGKEYPAEDGCSANQLSAEGSTTVSDRNQHQAKKATHTVC